MRDSARIWKFCNQLAEAWSIVPDMRFGQLIINAFTIAETQGKDPFYQEDNEMIANIKELCQRLSNGGSY